ncbi:MAG: FAD:protein FMN transferase, partial [Cellulomonadaceae bacterium]|nr:FAD:protein FMN transferase [Cellulomonadaceae bacterium]
WVWNVGIADPFDNQKVMARFSLRDGAVATSGPAERGAHIFNPETGLPASSMDGGVSGPDAGGGADAVVSATVIADSLTMADVWATTAVVAGFNDLSWISHADTKSGLLVSKDNRTRRWAGAVELPDA